MAADLLAGVRVLDLSRVLAGPWATQLLADLGADVVKIERPVHGDDTRGWGPPWVGEGDDRLSAYFVSCNRGKRSVAVDVASTDGQDLVRRLAARADVVVENFKPGALARYGLDAASLRRDHPGLVVCSISGFGQTGPLRDLPGYDLMIQGMSGLMSITGDPAGPPMKVGVAVADLMTGMYAATAIVAALFRRTRTGEGAWLDLALLDTSVAWLANQGLNHLATGVPPGRMGNAHPNLAPYEVFPTADGWLCLAVGNDGQFAALAALAGHPEWSLDPRFQTNAARVTHRATLVPAVADAVARRTTGWWLAACGEAGIPCGPILDLGQVFGHPQTVARGAVARVDGVPTLAQPIHVDGARPVAARRPPRLGEHDAEVARDWLGA